jgi:hypothetical protein
MTANNLAISGLSLQTPSARMTKSAGSKTWPFTRSSRLLKKGLVLL